MRRGFLFFQFNQGIALGIFLLAVFGTGLTGCAPTSLGSNSRPVICTPQAPNVNIYRVTPVPAPGTNGAVSSGVTSVTTDLTQEQVLALLAQPQQELPVSPINYSAFGSMITETKNWSDIQTIKLDNSSQAQIIVTFLSPQLIQAVYYNDYYSNGGSTVPNAQPALDAVANRDELIFFVAVITTTNNNLNTPPHKIRIPIQEMVIVNAEDVMASPLRDDHNLAQEINSSYEPVFGYLTYPIAMINGTDCSWILNPDYNKKIIITVPNIFVDGSSVGSYTWDIPYSSLFKSALPPTSQSNMAFDSSQMSSSLTPPSPMESLLIPNGLKEAIFWQTYARFLWKQIMVGFY